MSKYMVKFSKNREGEDEEKDLDVLIAVKVDDDYFTGCDSEEAAVAAAECFVEKEELDIGECIGVEPVDEEDDEEHDWIFAEDYVDKDGLTAQEREEDNLNMAYPDADPEEYGWAYDEDGNIDENDYND